MYCQTCGAKNADDREHCRSCNGQLLVVSGAYTREDQEAFESDPEEQFSFDEHLLERISILEEVMKRTAETLRGSLGTLYKLEQKILVNQTGITTLRDLLESKRLIAREEWSELWESRMDQQLLALEKRERFAAVKARIASLYRGERGEDFRRRLDDAETALLGFDIDAAVRALEEAHRLDPENHELAFFLAETFFNEGESAPALEYFGRVLAVKPGHFESLVYAGVLQHERGDATKAEDLLRRAAAQYPDAFLPAFSLGAVHAGQGRLPQAVAFLERAVAADPIPQAYFLLGSCLYEMGKVTPAIRQLESAIRQDPSFEDAHHLLGLAYLDRRWVRKALVAFGEAQRLSPGRLAYPELAEILAAAGVAAAAVVPRGGAAPSSPGEAAELRMQAEAAMSGGQVRHALHCYRRALALEPDDPTLLVAYAMACLELGRAAEIESVVDKVLGLEPTERLRASAYATWIEALRSQGRFREGNRVGRLLLESCRSEFARTLGYYEMACNLAEAEEDLDEALRLARRSLDLAPRELRPYPLAALGWVHFQRREYERAVDCLAESSELKPSARTLNRLGMALLAAGRRDPARDVLRRAHRLEERRGALDEKLRECLRDGTRRLLDAPRRERR